MKQVIQVTRKRDYIQERLAVLRMELDYELAVLFEAMELENKTEIDSVKERLSLIRHEMNELGGFSK
ncbi:hypothetical protein KP77_16940 [Jeotgalibacillus alimentarius]|uniref:Uncharacterized protein n=2 Tax=Jeotgalibacillus TaxID=157226 RepID=A0A0C2S8J1_9BACL|nr:MULTISPECIES: hypothetical protein [Jeotgalibacillus]KIL50319.1 hypothetical protein KP77_16940 [Jeotgalibacillus alimentarius]MBM7578348.1 hypothetical protein [Jeotgalibacillus terrae]